MGDRVRVERGGRRWEWEDNACDEPRTTNPPAHPRGGHVDNPHNITTSTPARSANFTLQIHHRKELPRHYRPNIHQVVRPTSSTHTPIRILTVFQRYARSRFRRCRGILCALLLRRGAQGSRGHHEEDPDPRKLLRTRDSARGQPVLGATWDDALDGLYNMEAMA